MPHYSFGISHAPLQVGPYSEYHHTEIEAVCVAPKRFVNRTTSFTLMGDRGHTADLMHPDQATRTPMGVGTLTMRGDQSNYLGSYRWTQLCRFQSPFNQVDTGSFISLASRFDTDRLASATSASIKITTWTSFEPSITLIGKKCRPNQSYVYHPDQVRGDEVGTSHPPVLHRPHLP